MIIFIDFLFKNIYSWFVNIDLDSSSKKSRKAPYRSAKKTVCVSFAADILTKIDTRARKRGLSRSGLVNLAVTESLENWERSEEKDITR
jgi:hypothetical protein